MRRMLLLAAVVTFGYSGSAAAEDWPTRPIRALTTTSAGGISDVFMRALGEKLRERLGQPIVVENRPGGAQMVGARACQDSAPDGYTICIINADAMIYNQFLFKSLPFDPVNGLQPVTDLFDLIHMLVVNANLGVKNVDELCALSKAKAGTLSYLAPGAPMVLYMETLKKEKGCDWVRVPFRGGGEAVNSIMNGSTPIGLIGIGNVLGHLQAGTMTALVMPNNIKVPQYPDVPTLEETGYRGPASGSWYGLFVPPGTPRPIIDKLAAEMAKVVTAPAFADKNLYARGLVPAINTPEQFDAQIKRERIVARDVVKEAGLEPQ